MTRVFLSNFDFEHRLAGVHRKSTDAISAELSFTWLSVAGPGDHVCGMPPVEQRLRDALQKLGRGLPDAELKSSEQLVPWAGTQTLGNSGPSRI